MKSLPLIRISVFFALTLISLNAYAYVGPGLGLGLIGVILAGIVTLLLAIAGVVWYPVKRLLKKMRTTKSSAKGSNADAPQQENDDDSEI